MNRQDLLDVMRDNIALAFGISPEDLEKGIVKNIPIRLRGRGITVYRDCKISTFLSNTAQDMPSIGYSPVEKIFCKKEWQPNEQTAVLETKQGISYRADSRCNE